MRWMNSLFLFLFLCPFVTVAQDVSNKPQGEQIPGPLCSQIGPPSPQHPTTCGAAEAARWLEDVRHWRLERSIRVGADHSEYTRSSLLWAQSSFVQPQLMVHDRYFYDPQAGRYTVDRYIADVTRRYGGIDSVLIWPTYPNIGIDDRNQYDLFRDLPGGIEGVRTMVDDFHRYGVRVLFPVMVWDQGTRREDVPDAIAISREVAEANGDGINGDTLNGMPRSFRKASDEIGHPLALEPENSLDTEEMLNYNNLSWGYWKYGFTPAISRYKWLETRHMVHLSNRWAHHHLDDLQHAFFNGIGFESWENIWGIWNQMTPRDSEILRRIATIERAFAPLLISPDWVPHTATQQFGVFASQWPATDQTLWTLVNRNSYTIEGEQLQIPHTQGARYFDLWHGVELAARDQGDTTILSFGIEADGFGCILRSMHPDEHLVAVLASMKRLADHPLNSYSDEWTSLPQHLVETAPVISYGKDKSDEAVRISEGDFVFRVNSIEIEGMNEDGVDVQYPWETSPRRYHQHSMHLGAFSIDKYPVTNAAYKRFVDTTGYRPPDDHNYLRDWKNGTIPAGWENRPVTWVSIEDARAYAAWAGKRLPHEWEWQYAAQGNDERLYPWGSAYPDSFPADAPIPKPDTERSIQPPSNVSDHPSGASPLGVMDLVGNVWQWTDEYSDEHTRFAILRGGSHYQPQGSRWYFPQAYRLNEHGKYLLMSPSLDRSATIGFRCVRDVK